MSRPSARSRGVSLVETVVVVAVLAVAASIAIPKADAVNPAVVDAAAGQVADAMRFARREAIRTGAYHVVMLDTTAQTLRVYRLTTSGTIAEDTGNPVLNPLDLRAYRVSFTDGTEPNATVGSATFSYTSGAITSYAAFGPDGAPAYLLGRTSKDVDPLKSDGTVTLVRGNASRTVTVAAVTGRVTS